jgi:hypothetical protein
MANIFARSPYIIRIAEATQNGSKVELFLSNTTSFTGSPQYTLSKLIPASNNIETLYDISPYIREYIRFASCSAGGNAAVTNPTTERVNVRVKRYKLVGSTYSPTATDPQLDYIAFDGSTYYESGYNFDLGNYGLDAGNYYYNPTSDPGKIRVTGLASYTAKYTSFDLVPVVNSLSISNGTYDIPRVRTSPNNLLVGNKVEILDAASGVLKTYFFYPQDECKYTPVIIDFVNKYGAWQREFFFKASNDNFSVESTEYNLLQTSRFNSSPSTFYSGLEGQRKVFNANGKKSIKVNTGWVNESWKEVLKQIMLSERILIDNKPAKINSKSTELFKSINTKQINYSLDFEFAYDVINSVI